MPSDEVAALAIDGWVAGDHAGLPEDDQRRALGYGGFGTLTPPVGLGAQFGLGELVLTPGALAVLGTGATIDASAVVPCLGRFVVADWGEATPEEKVVNAAHLAADGRLVGRYSLGDGRTLVLITEYDRSSTTVAASFEATSPLTSATPAFPDSTTT